MPPNLGGKAGKYPGKYPGNIWNRKILTCYKLKVFTFSLLPKLRNHAKFLSKFELKWVITYPVGKKVNIPVANTWVFTFLRKYPGCSKVNTVFTRATLC